MSDPKRKTEELGQMLQADLEQARRLYFDIADIFDRWEANPAIGNGLASGISKAAGTSRLHAGEVESLQQLAHQHFRQDSDPKVTSITGRQAG